MEKVLQLKNKKIAVTGGHGFVGSWLIRELKKVGVKSIFAPTSKECDLRTLSGCKKLVKNQDIVIHLAAYVGGIGLNQKHPGRLFYDNALMGIQLIEEARKAKVEKMLITGTACSYPKNTPIPFKEENFWDGFPEQVTGMYGMAKKMLLVQAQAYRQEYGFNCIYVIPVNMYGPGDDDDPEHGHVIPSLIRRMNSAKRSNEKEFVVWGTGKATREFLYVEDAAKGIIAAVKRYNGAEPVNLGTGKETSIKELVLLMKKIIGYNGKIVWDTTKPDGQKRRVMDISKAQRYFGFFPQTPIEVGLRKTIKSYLKV